MENQTIFITGITGQDGTFLASKLINEKNNLKIYLVKSAKIIHTGEKSVDKKFDEDVELIRNWHLMWSTYYFHKKHFGVIVAYKKIFPKFFSEIVIIL